MSQPARLLARVRGALAEMEVRPRVLLATVVLELGSGLLKVAAIALCLPLFHQLLAAEPHGGIGTALQRLLPGMLSGSHWQIVARVVTLILAAAVLGGLCGTWAARRTARVAADAEVALGEKLLRRHLRFAQGYFDTTKQGSTLSHLQGLPRRAGRLVPWSLQAGEALLSLALLAILMVALSPLLAAASLVVLSVYYFLVKRFVDRAERQAQEEEELEEAALIEIQDVVANLSLLRIFASERRAVAEFRGRAVERAEAGRRSRGQVELIDQARDVLNTGVVLAFALAAAWSVQGIDSSVLARHLVFFFVFRRAMGPFAELQRLPRRWRFLDEQIDTLQQLLHGTAQPILVAGTRTFSGLNRGVAVRDLTFAYGENPPVLEGVTCEALRGRYTTLVGRTGSGKSTLLRLWLRLYDPPPDTIFLDGVDLREFDAESLRSRIAFADAHPHLFHATLRENLTYGLDDSGPEQVREAIAAAGLGAVVERLPRGLDEVLGDRGTRLSTGERQRVGLARALLRDADLILWDEATSALDAVAERQVLAVAERLAQERTVVTVTHRLSTIPASAWVVVLERGAVAQQGYRDDLMTAGGALSVLMAAGRSEAAGAPRSSAVD